MWFGPALTIVDKLKGTSPNLQRESQTIIDALAVPFQTDKKPARISASVGIAFYPGDASTPLTLLQAADHAMYVAKSLGSNRMCFFSTAEDKNSPVFGG